MRDFWGMLACLGIVALVLGSGCKDEDRDPPAVALSSPNQGFSVVADSEFTVSGRATDNRGLTGLTAILYASTTEEVVQTKTVTISGVQQDFSFSMPAGDRYTASGDYTLRVTASDAAENIGSAFIQISVQELPLEYQGMFWAGEGNGGFSNLYFQDTTSAVVTGPSGLEGLSDLLVDNRNRYVLASQSLGGVLSAWDLTGFTQIFRVDLAQGTGTQTYSGLAMNRNSYYASLKVPDYLRSYRFDGTLKNNFESVLYPATAVMATNDRIYLGVRDDFGSVKKLDVYRVSDDQLIATQVLGWDVDGILQVSASEVLAFGNENGMGRVVTLDATSLVENASLELTESVIDAVTANGRVWLLLQSGLVEFFPANGTISGNLVSGNYFSLGVGCHPQPCVPWWPRHRGGVHGRRCVVGADFGQFWGSEVFCGALQPLGGGLGISHGKL